MLNNWSTFPLKWSHDQHRKNGNIHYVRIFTETEHKLTRWKAFSFNRIFAWLSPSVHSSTACLYSFNASILLTKLFFFFFHAFLDEFLQQRTLCCSLVTKHNASYINKLWHFSFLWAEERADNNLTDPNTTENLRFQWPCKDRWREKVIASLVKCAPLWYSVRPRNSSHALFKNNDGLSFKKMKLSGPGLLP